MGTPPNIRRLRTEDFSPDDRELIEKISYAMNEFMDQTIFLFTNGIDFRNLNQEIKDIDITTDGSGDAVDPPTINTSIKGKAIGVFTINATNLNDASTIPTSQPFVSFTINTGQVSILNVSGLQASSKYRLKVLIIGDNIGS